MSGGFFRGTSADQDMRFSNKQKKLKREMRFPAHFDRKVDMHLVKVDVIKMWLRETIVNLLGFEDDVLIGMVENMLAESTVDPKDMQIQLTGFLEDKAAPFMGELWAMLLSAQENGGIPKQIIDKKKEELAARKMEEERLQAEIRMRQHVAQINATTAAGNLKQKEAVLAAAAIKPEVRGTSRRLNEAQQAALQVYAPGQSEERRKPRRSKWDTVDAAVKLEEEEVPSDDPKSPPQPASPSPDTSDRRVDGRRDSPPSRSPRRSRDRSRSPRRRRRSRSDSRERDHHRRHHRRHRSPPHRRPRSRSRSPPRRSRDRSHSRERRRPHRERSPSPKRLRRDTPPASDSSSSSDSDGERGQSSGSEADAKKREQELREKALRTQALKESKHTSISLAEVQ